MNSLGLSAEPVNNIEKSRSIMTLIRALQAKDRRSHWSSPRGLLFDAASGQDGDP